MATTPILNLETITDLPVVDIDGQHYPLLTLDALPLSALLQLRKMGRRFDELANKAETTEAEEVELDDLTDRICRRILQAPAAVHDTLKGLQRFAVCQAFQGLPSNRMRLQATGSGGPKPTATRRTTGATSSRGSRGATRGSRRRHG